MKPMEIIQAYVAQILSAKFFKVFVWGAISTISFLMWDITLPVIACMILYLSDLGLWLGINMYKGTFSWDKLRQGIYKFLLYWGVIIVGHMLDLIFVHTTPDFWARYVIILYLGVTEGLSVMKHLARLGWKAPQKLINRLEGVRDELDSIWQEPIKVSPLIVTETNQSSNTTSNLENQSV